VSGTYLLDANAAVALVKGDVAIRQLVSQADDIHVSSIAIGELYYGAEKSGRVSANLREVDDFVKRYSMLACDTETARIYGHIRQQLRLKGRPIPDNDLWIAAVALQHGLILLTRDAHFNHVDGLTVRSW
jgi:tRNA(fMet)-specific endonuclease VapC